MFPNSPNAKIILMNIINAKDSLGQIKPMVKSKKEVVGSIKSITSTEFQTSVLLGKSYDLKAVLQAFVYDESKYAVYDDRVYKIERTYITGQFIELYLALTELSLEELHGN